MISLSDLFESINVQGNVILYSVDEHMVIADSRMANMDGESMPKDFSDFADCRVRYMFPSNGGIAIEVDAPEETEIFYTGGGIYCAVHKLGDGTWFTGATNEFGGVYATKKAAMESFGEGEDFIRYVEDLEEQKRIWRDIYRTEIERGGDYDGECREWLKSLDSDLESI